LGLPEREPVIIDMIQQLAQVNDDVMDRLGVDMRNISPRSSATFQIQVGDMGDYTYFYDEFGIGWRSPKDGGYYYDMPDHPTRRHRAEWSKVPPPDPLDPYFVGLRRLPSGRRGTPRHRGLNIPAGIPRCSPGCGAMGPTRISSSRPWPRVIGQDAADAACHREKALSIVGDVIDVARSLTTSPARTVPDLPAFAGC
jgi:hypothetical protein